MAAYYPDELISEVIAANDLVDVASSYMKLSRSGSGYKGLCPFHGEKTPSFHISPDKQLYHCFGCGAGGSVLQFVMNIESLDFVEAVKFLAERAKIALPEGDGRSQDSEFYKRKQAVYEMNTVAAKYFFQNLMSPAGEKAQAYFLRRELSPKTVTAFGLGFALDSFTALTDYLKGKGFGEQQILDAGLAKRSEKTGKLFDFFRNRVMFPIIDIRGNVIAFGGRVMDDSLPKYLNSPDSIVFNKSKTLFALNFAKRVCHRQLILCEGYMDVISLHQADFSNAVATLGTALTPEHAKLISRYTAEVVLCYDSDGAGQKATASAMELLRAVKLRTRVLTVPGAKDPDEFIKKKGRVAFENLINSSENAVLYKISKLKEQYSVDILEEKIELTNKMAEVFAAVENPIEQEVLIRDSAKELGISPETIFSQVKLLQHNKEKKEQSKAVKAAMKNAVGPKNSLPHREGLLASLIAGDERVYAEMKDQVQPGFFTSSACRAFIREVYQLRQKGLKIDSAVVISSLPPEDAQELAGIFTDEKPYDDPVRAAKEIYQAIQDEKTKNAQNISSPEELASMIARLKGHK